ncbi:concanavalin A-like lectin/glucanase domain-containing protein [Aspergillus cavernicola]|uniref:Concanavalin A-like lectin/glucanase domain-containing protein n=1 Tax=Aspergillus cavernicola TaxID=176166 RepID=A0ABR4I6D5_9EURO
MKKFILSLLPGLSFIAPTNAVALPSPETANIAPRIPSHHPCDCYLTSGSDPGYFTNYKLWDFRNVPLPHSPNHGAYGPPDESLWETETIPLSESPFNTEWQAQSWRREKTKDNITPMVNSAQNTFFARHPQWTGTSQLVLRTTRLPGYSSTAEIESQQGNFYHCSIRVRMRLMSRDAIARAPGDMRPDNNTVPRGACAGIFTYRSATCESDLEFLTSDPPNTIHYANQPDYDAVNDIIIPGASKVVTTVPAPWSSWVTHRMDWSPNVTRWYADSQLQANVSISVPDRPSLLALNLWSDGGLWTGDLAINESVYMGIEWIEIAYNTSTAGGPPIELPPRHRHRPSKGGEGVLKHKRQFGGDEAGRDARCNRPCYLDKMQQY